MQLIGGNGEKPAVVATLRVHVKRDGTMDLSLDGVLKGDFIDIALAALAGAIPSVAEGDCLVVAAAL